ncbi:MAG: hypothetical protein O3A80_02445 [bacterium]|nr:hypothetical protein [bacterium]
MSEKQLNTPDLHPDIASYLADGNTVVKNWALQGAAVNNRLNDPLYRKATLTSYENILAGEKVLFEDPTGEMTEVSVDELPGLYEGATIQLERAKSRLQTLDQELNLSDVSKTVTGPLSDDNLQRKLLAAEGGSIEEIGKAADSANVSGIIDSLGAFAENDGDGSIQGWVLVANPSNEVRAIQTLKSGIAEVNTSLCLVQRFHDAQKALMARAREKQKEELRPLAEDLELTAASAVRVDGSDREIDRDRRTSNSNTLEFGSGPYAADNLSLMMQRGAGMPFWDTAYLQAELENVRKAGTDRVENANIDSPEFLAAVAALNAEVPDTPVDATVTLDAGDVSKARSRFAAILNLFGIGQ